MGFQVCFKMTKEKWEELPGLNSSQEEADTRILLHALHAAESGCKAVVISAVDTDILVLFLAVSRLLSLINQELDQTCFVGWAAE